MATRVPESKILSHTIIAGRSWGVHGRGRKYKLQLSCGHVDYINFSAGIPRSGMIECNDCVFAAMRAKVAAKHND